MRGTDEPAQRTSAQGQAITRTVMAKTSAYTPHGTSWPRYLRRCRGWRPGGRQAWAENLGHVHRTLPARHGRPEPEEVHNDGGDHHKWHEDSPPSSVPLEQRLHGRRSPCLGGAYSECDHSDILQPRPRQRGARSAMRSATRCTSALFDCASSTSFMICESAVSAPTRLTFTCITPWTLIDPAITCGASGLPTGGTARCATRAA